MILLISALLEACFSAIGAAIEAVGALLMEVGVLEGLAVGCFFLIELLLWPLLFLMDLVLASFQWRKPKWVSKPVIWRPKASGRD